MCIGHFSGFQERPWEAIRSHAFFKMSPMSMRMYKARMELEGPSYRAVAVMEIEERGLKEDGGSRGEEKWMDLRAA